MQLDKKHPIRFLVCMMMFFLSIGVLWSAEATAAPPVLYFSDLTSGPKTGLGDGLGSGAIVTIWGANLGSSQGGSQVLVGGVPAAYVYEWANATQHAGHPADLYTHHKMQAISFSIPAGAPDGATSIKVRVGGVDSNTLPFTVRAGSIYHVKTSGSDSGNGSWSSPWRSIYHYTTDLAGVAAGSICYVHDGVAESGHQYGLECSGLNGTEANPYFIAAYPGARVTIQGKNGGQAIGPSYNNGNLYLSKYWHFSKVKLMAGSNAYSYLTGGRLVGVEVTDDPNYPCISSMSGLLASSGSGSGLSGLDGNKLLGLYVHDYCKDRTGDKQQHTMYLSNRSGRSNQQAWEVGWNHLKNNWGNFGIHVYDEGACVNWQGTVKIHDNVVVDQRGAAIDIGPGCGSGYGPITTTFNVYNNLIIRGGRGPAFPGKTTSLFGMAFGGSTSNGVASLQQYTINAYNNTLYASGENSRDISTGSPVVKGNMQIGGAFGAVNLKNNIIYDSNNYPWVTSGGGTPTSSSHNLWYSTTGGHAAPPSWDVSPLTSNPLFTNAGNNDFSITTSSPAKDAGINSSPAVSSDILGLARNGYACDIGAFECGNSSPAQTTHIVSPSAGANGSISPNIAQTVNSGASLSFTVTPNSGYMANIGGTCGGSLSGSTYTTSPVTADCTVTATFVPVPVYSVGGTVSGLNTSGIFAIQNNGSQTLYLAADGSYAFPTLLSNGAAYAVTIISQPAGKSCSVANGSGTISSASVSNVNITCVSTTPVIRRPSRIRNLFIR
ncbi:MAG: choice-of-anchor Q domain-containing protein [Nitrospirota bacterium]